MTEPNEVTPHKKVQDAFMQDVADLIAKYPSIATQMTRHYAVNPEEGEEGNGWPAFDPNCPTVLSGLVVVCSYANLDGYEDLGVMTMKGQGLYTTLGMLAAASETIC